jgi:predicted O-methyltransferase YrrM
MNIRRTFLDLIQPWPIPGREGKRSVILPPRPGPVSARLEKITLQAAQAAHELEWRTKNLPSAVKQCLEQWPGEHYRLLAGLMQTLQPRGVIEIGTFTGVSALTLRAFLPSTSTLTTFDVVPWHQLVNTALTPTDFADGKMTQHIADLSQPEALETHRHLLETADFFFIDAAKDGVQERKFLENLRRLHFKMPPILLFDDIRLWKMLRIWDEIPEDKLDITSLGHWTGTGLVDFQRKG